MTFRRCVRPVSTEIPARESSINPVNDPRRIYEPDCQTGHSALSLMSYSSTTWLPRLTEKETISIPGSEQLSGSCGHRRASAERSSAAIPRACRISIATSSMKSRTSAHVLKGGIACGARPDDLELAVFHDLWNLRIAKPCRALSTSVSSRGSLRRRPSSSFDGTAGELTDGFACSSRPQPDFDHGHPS